MKEVLQPKIDFKNLQVEFLPLQNLDQEGYKLRDGYSGSPYRGNHRSDNRGAGFRARIRSLWQYRYKRLRHKR